MKFTAFALEFMGLVIAGGVAFQYFGAEPGSGPSGTRSGLLLGFAVALMTGGAAMLAFGGKGYSESAGATYEHPRARLPSER
jgi:hypothetical protein